MRGKGESRWKEGTPWEAGLLVLGAGLSVHLTSCWQQAPCHHPWAGDRERNYCKWKGQVSLVSQRSGLGKHVSQDDSTGRLPPYTRPPLLPPTQTWLPEHPAFPLCTQQPWWAEFLVFSLLSG